ncbi:transcription termination factor Rho, partial [bacterium]
MSTLAELKQKTHQELVEIARSLGIPYAGLKKERLVHQILARKAEEEGLILGEGVLEIVPQGYGFLRSAAYSYTPGPDDIYVSQSQIKKFNLKTGDTVLGQVRPPKQGEKFFSLVKVEAINFEPPDKAKERVPFESLTPL